MTCHHLHNRRGFFSDYYFGTVFGAEGRGRRRKGPPDRETRRRQNDLRRIRERAEGRAEEADACRERFIRPMLRDVLGFHLGAGQERVHALFSSADDEAAGARPLLVAYCGAWDEDPDAGRGQAAPLHRVESALARMNLRHGLLVTGQVVRLVRQAGDGPRGACLQADLEKLAEDDDTDSFATFLLLMSQPAFRPCEDGTTPIEQVEEESTRHAGKVTEDLKRAVFTAAETLTQGLLDDAVARGVIARGVDVTEADLRDHRDAALLAIYRALFILYAEARDTRLDEHQLYRKSYSAQGMVDELLDGPTREWADNRWSLWSRLKALFRIYDEGLPALTPWVNIPPRGGDFFSATSDTGKILAAARLPDRIVADVVRLVATTQPRRGVGVERVSFRELDIESLGSVYEGLLEFEPRVALQPTFEVRVQGRTFALTAEELARLCCEKKLELKGDPATVEGTAAAGLHPSLAAEDEDEDDETVEGDLDVDSGPEETGAEEQDEEDSVRKGGSARILRRIEPGRFHFVAGSARKGSGSFYTPRPLVHDLVHHALGPLLEGRTAGDIEKLRVLDPACGSAHFLVEAMRFMGAELHRACAEEYGAKGPPHFRATQKGGWDDNWRATDEQARAANSEARAWCKRRIAECCLFGVDRNPTAVQLARVALWIESVAGDRPLSFFEHHVRCGNSLLGSWIDRVDQPPLPAMAKKSPAGQLGLFAQVVRETVREAAGLRRLIDETDPAALLRQAIEPDTPQAHRYKNDLLGRADEMLSGPKLLFDLRSASAFLPEIWIERDTLWGKADDPASLKAYVEARPWWEQFENVCTRERFFHWELEFPEVFLDERRRGFDAVLGNPPWDKVLPTKLDFYGRHDVLVRAYRGADMDRRIRELHAEHPGLAAEFSGYREQTTTAAQLLRKGGDFPLSEARSQAAHEDLSKYFVDRAARLAAEGGRVGLVAPSVVYNGDGCVGIRRFLLTEATIERFYGFENRSKLFPIHASYKFVSLVFRKGRPAAGRFHAAFMRHDLEELADDARKPWMVEITREEIEMLSPETLAFLEYRSARDQEIVRRMHQGRPTLGGEGPGAWCTTLISWRVHDGIYNAAEDRDLWTDPATGRPYSPRSVLGHEPADFGETSRLMRERGFWPVFEGKHVEQFLVGIKPVRWWLSVAAAKSKYKKAPREASLLVFRETASNTNERTCIATTLPDHSAGSHKLTGVLLEAASALAATAVFDSICFDYLLRLRTAGTSVSHTYILPVAIPPASVVNRLPSIPTRLAWESGITHVTEDRGSWPALWEANRAVAEAYDLTPDDFEHILGSFPVMARKRPEYVAYLRRRLEEWRAESAKVLYPKPLDHPPEDSIHPHTRAAEPRFVPGVSSKPLVDKD